MNHAAFYRRFLGPVAKVYRRLGVGADIKGINDVAAGRCRISGTGAGEIGDCVAFSVRGCFFKFKVGRSSFSFPVTDQWERHVFKLLFALGFLPVQGCRARIGAPNLHQEFS